MGFFLFGEIVFLKSGTKNIFRLYLGTAMQPKHLLTINRIIYLFNYLFICIYLFFMKGIEIGLDLSCRHGWMYNTEYLHSRSSKVIPKCKIQACRTTWKISKAGRKEAHKKQRGKAEGAQVCAQTRHTHLDSDWLINLLEKNIGNFWYDEVFWK